MRSNFIPAFMLSTLAVFTSATSAAPTYEITHSGSVNPQLEGWRAIDIVASTQNEFTLPRPGVGPITDGNVDAWQIDNPAGNTSDTSAYWATGLGGGNILNGNYWQFAAKAKALPSDNSTDNSRLNSAFRIMAFSRNYYGTQLGNYWMVTLQDIESDGTRVRIDGQTGNAVDVMVSDGYHWYDLIYDPATGADFYIDGQLVQSNIAYTGTAPIGNRVEFGDLQQVNDGFGGGNWASVYFAYDDDEPFSPIGVPEPASLGLLLGGAGALLGRFRN